MIDGSNKFFSFAGITFLALDACICALLRARVFEFLNKCQTVPNRDIANEYPEWIGRRVFGV